jgi:hypothetical protein
VLIVAGQVVTLCSGCGGGPTFTASGFIDRINPEGVSIQLGRRLPSGGDAEQVYAVSLPPLPGEPAPAGCSAFRRRTSSSLLNDEGGGLEAQRLALAMKRLAR